MAFDERPAVQVGNVRRDTFKRKAAEELKEFAVLASYLAFCFCALATYSVFLLRQFDISYFAYGTALLNALVLAKVIMLGEAMHAGTRFERKALLHSALWKAFVFAWLVFGFHVVEETIRGLMHGQTLSGAFHDIHLDDMLLRTVLVFAIFIPLFIIRELVRALRRVTGQENLRAIFHAF